MKHGFLGVLLLLCQPSWADSWFEQHCQPIAIADAQAQLQVKKPALVVLHSRSDAVLWLTHPIKDPGASAGWTSELHTDHWSALFLTPQKNSFNVACIKSIPGHEQRTPCAEVLRICTLPTDVVPQNVDGAFWVVENSTKDMLIPDLVQRGFKWSSAG